MSSKTPQIGLESESLQQVAEQLQTLLADTYVLYTKTQVFHWNVEGPRFHMLHKMFEEQYQELFAALDDIAERIRTLGMKTPNGLQALISMATIEESSAELSDEEMVAVLLKDHESICQKSRALIQLAEEQGDVGTADFVTARLEKHEKTAWMLRSSSSA